MADRCEGNNMAALPVDHYYAKITPRIKRTEEKTPSFLSFHSYSNPSTSLSTPVRNPKRPRGTPTGATPKQPTKRVGGVKWTEQEKTFLFLYIKEHPPVTPISNKYWRECADSMNTQLSITRTDASCRGFYNRLSMQESPSPPDHSDYSDYSDLGTVLDTEADRSICIGTSDVACQTDISFPLNNSDHEPMNDESQQNMEKIQTNENAVLFLKKSAMVKTDKGDSALQTTFVNKILSIIMNAGTVKDIASCVYNSSSLRQCLWSMFLCQMEDSAKCMTERKQTYLSNTSYDDLVEFEWHCIIDEIARTQGLLLDVLLAVYTPRKLITKDEHYQKHMKEIGLIYGILMKRRYKDLSRVQRFIAIALANEKVHQKVYDRLQKIGVTVSHSTVLKVQRQISGNFNKELIEAVEGGRKFRLVGDNVNFMAGVSHQRKEKVQHMEHWFASAAIIQPNDFSHLPGLQQPILDMTPDTFIPQLADWKIIKFDYIVSILDVLTTYMQCFNTFKPVLREMKKELLPEGCDITKVSQVIPLTVLAKNEQKYADVVDILDSYEDLISDVYQASGICMTQQTKIHVGGDQLTRERFSGAKRLRSGAVSEKERLCHISPITFELFHLQMNVLTMFYKLLYNTNSTEPGTLYAEKVKLSRSQANGEDVKNHYNDCKELAVSLIDAHVVEAALHYFEMESVESEPKNQFAEVDVNSMTDNQKKEFVQNILGTFVDKYILEQARRDIERENEDLQSNFYQVQIQLPDGRPVTMLVPVQTASHDSSRGQLTDDSVEAYAHRVLEIGLAYKCLQANIKTPNRERMLSLMKYMMCLLKGHNNNSKYALEILRFLAHQFALLDEKNCQRNILWVICQQQGEK